MQYTITQLFLSLFLLFALTRVIFRFKEGILPQVGLFFWSGIFLTAIIIVLFPGLTSSVAQRVGIGRGADIVIYISISLIFYLIFRLYIFLEDLKNDMTELVKELALKNVKKRDGRKTSKN